MSPIINGVATCDTLNFREMFTQGLLLATMGPANPRIVGLKELESRAREAYELQREAYPSSGCKEKVSPIQGVDYKKGNDFKDKNGNNNYVKARDSNYNQDTANESWGFRLVLWKRLFNY